MAVKSPTQIQSLLDQYYPTNGRGQITATDVRTSLFEAFVQSGVVEVISVGDNDPPGSPAANAAYVVGSVPTGAWVGKTNKIAYRNAANTDWLYYPSGSITTAYEGLQVWAADEDKIYSWTGTAWQGEDASTVAGLTSDDIENQSSVTGVTVSHALDNLEAQIAAIDSGTVESAQDAIGAMVDASLVYVDATPLLSRAALTGDVTAAQGSNATTIANDAVTNAKLANVATATFKGRSTAGTGDPEDLTATIATALLDQMVGDTGTGGLKGLVPAPTVGDSLNFLKGDGSWATPSGSYSDEQAQDAVAAAIAAGTQTNIIVTYNDTSNTLSFTVAGSSGSATVPVDFKDSVDLATTANITLSGEQTIDGTLTSASRVLVKNQSAGADNGIYVTGAGAWTRSTDADTSGEMTSGLLVYVESGTANGNQVFMLVTPDPITLGSTVLSFQAIALPTSVFVRKTVAGTTYTHILSDSGKKLAATNAGTKTITIAPQASVGSAVNTTIKVINEGAGLLTLAPGAGVTLNSLGGVLTVPQNHEVQLQKRANPNIWDVTGIYDVDTLKSDTAANLTAGFTATAYNAGTQSSGTYTPDPDNGNFQRAVNGGAHVLALPSASPGDSVDIVVQYTNNASAGAIDTTAFDIVNGDALTTVNGDDFFLNIRVCNGFSRLNVEALQ